MNALSTDENELWQRIKRGDAEALKTLFYAHYKTLCAVGSRVCDDPEEGKDIAQQVFILLWEKRQQITIEGEILPYLKRMTINEALGKVRTAKRKNELSSNIDRSESVRPEGEDHLIHDELQDRIYEAIGELPEKCGEVFKLSRFEDLTYREIGESLNISIKTVENHMGRALRQLKEALKSYMTMFF